MPQGPVPLMFQALRGVHSLIGVLVVYAYACTCVYAFVDARAYVGFPSLEYFRNSSQPFHASRAFSLSFVSAFSISPPTVWSSGPVCNVETCRRSDGLVSHTVLRTCQGLTLQNRIGVAQIFSLRVRKARLMFSTLNSTDR